MSGSWTTVSFPRRATFDPSVREPATFLADLMVSAVNHGMPARRRGGRVIAWVGRHEPPSRPIAAVLRRLPRREAPGLDRVLDDVREAWPTLAARGVRLPEDVPDLSALQVTRSAAETCFVFGGSRFPLLVLKRPHPDEVDGVGREIDALLLAEQSGVAPRYLGRVGPFHVQEGLPGLPLRVDPVWPDRARDLPRPAAFAALDRGLERLGATTVTRGRQWPDLLPRLEASARHPLPATARAAVEDAVRRLADLDLAVLQHKDLSPQNWLVDPADPARAAGLVDWELAAADGVPGHDALAASVSLFEHGVALTRWSGEDVVAGFDQAWRHSPFFAGARESFCTSARAAGVPETSLEALQLSYFAVRLGRSLTRGVAGQALAVPHLAAMLSTVADAGLA